MSHQRILRGLRCPRPLDRAQLCACQGGGGGGGRDFFPPGQLGHLFLFFKIHKAPPYICPEECETFTNGLSFYFIFVWTNEEGNIAGRTRQLRRQLWPSGPCSHATINGPAPTLRFSLCQGFLDCKYVVPAGLMVASEQPVPKGRHGGGPRFSGHLCTADREQVLWGLPGEGTVVSG